MKTLPLMAIAIASFLVPALSGSAAGDRNERYDVRTLEKSFEISGTRVLRVEMPPGEIRIEPATDDRVRVELSARCERGDERCPERAEDLTLITSPEGGTFHLRVEGMPTINSRGLSLRGRILVPAGLALEMEMGAGELEVDGIENHCDLEVGAGEVRVRMRERDVRSVRLSVGVGEARLSVGGRTIERDGWLGKRVRWSDGPGASRLNVNLGVGEARVELD